MDYDQPSAGENTEINILDSEVAGFQYEYAGTGQRFLNYLIDNLLMNFGISYITAPAVEVLIRLAFPSLLENLIPGQFSWAFFTISLMISYSNYLLYYTLCEKLFKGYTLGKLITGTRALQENGDELTLKNAVLRSLCRLVPFEVLSGFKIRPWHDEWTNTMVIKAR
jgi:uncharacterized RDD family membrane protein YckC